MTLHLYKKDLWVENNQEMLHWSCLLTQKAVRAPVWWQYFFGFIQPGCFILLIAFSGLLSYYGMLCCHTLRRKTWCTSSLCAMRQSEFESKFRERHDCNWPFFVLLLLFLLPGWLRCWKGWPWKPKWQDRINFFIPSFLLAEPRTLEIWCVFSYYFCRKNGRKRSRFGGFNSRVLFFSFFWVFFFSTCLSNKIESRCCKVLSEFLLLHNTKWPAAWPAAHLIKLSLEIYLHQSAAANPPWPDHLVLAAVLCIKRRLQSGQSLGKVASWISLQSLIPLLGALDWCSVS